MNRLTRAIILANALAIVGGAMVTADFSPLITKIAGVVVASASGIALLLGKYQPMAADGAVKRGK